MAYRVSKPTMNNRGAVFPPEADTEFDIVETEEIAAWQEKLNKRFGIGSGKLKPLDEIDARN